MKEFMNLIGVVILGLSLGCSNSAEPLKPEPHFEVVVTSDKLEYLVGEPIVITIENRSTEAIHVWSGICPKGLRRQELGNWIPVWFCGDPCICPAVEPFTVAVEPGRKMRQVVSAYESATWLSPGTYRGAFSLEQRGIAVGGSYSSNSFTLGSS